MQNVRANDWQIFTITSAEGHSPGGNEKLWCHTGLRTRSFRLATDCMAVAICSRFSRCLFPVRSFASLITVIPTCCTKEQFTPNAGSVEAVVSAGFKITILHSTQKAGAKPGYFSNHFFGCGLKLSLTFCNCSSTSGRVSCCPSATSLSSWATVAYRAMVRVAELPDLPSNLAHFVHDGPNVMRVHGIGCGPLTYIPQSRCKPVQFS